ncbi:hypothetical protein DY000_02033712 [Brassica cretica]|uniref:Uncharacterized protein n=1 Tax=Brassica cretica TaxID=69181 RepID=A0ABQ7DU28_BRACR|nr:hypothetical protein DY000_02033712 [Brassica cretica]
MTLSMFLDGRSEDLRILPITLDQQPKNTNAPIEYHSRLFNPKKQYSIVSFMIFHCKQNASGASIIL